MAERPRDACLRKTGQIAFFCASQWGLKAKDIFYTTTAESVNITLSQTFINKQISSMGEQCEVAFLSHYLGYE